MDVPPQEREGTELRPNVAEKTLGIIGAVTVAPLLLPIVPLVRFLSWTTTAGQQTLLKRALTAVAGLAVFGAFIVICVVAVPYMALYALLRAVGLVRPPPPEELEDETSDSEP